MSIGIPLSQLISDKPKSISSGYTRLDKEIDGGFQKKNIYEIYGVPGINRTRMGLNICRNFNLNNPDEKILWIDVHNKVNISDIDKDESLKSKLYYTKINNFSQMLFFIQNLKSEYSVIIIDGFSQLVVNHINVMLQRMNPNNKVSIHDIKCRHLLIIFSLFTSYINLNNSLILLLDDCMNTSFDVNKINELDKQPEFNDNFLISTERNARKNVQMLKSALTANAALGYKDYKWEKFIKYRIGLFWDWRSNDDNSQSGKGDNDVVDSEIGNKVLPGVPLTQQGDIRGTLKYQKTVVCALVTKLQNANITKLVKLQEDERDTNPYQKRRKIDISSNDSNLSLTEHTIMETRTLSLTPQLDDSSLSLTQGDMSHFGKDDEYVDDSEG